MRLSTRRNGKRERREGKCNKMERRGQDRKGGEWRGEEERRMEMRGGHVYINII